MPHAHLRVLPALEPLAFRPMAAARRRFRCVHAETDDYARASLAGEPSPCRVWAFVPRPVQVISGARRRTLLSSSALRRAERLAGQFSRVRGRVAMVESLASGLRNGRRSPLACQVAIVSPAKLGWPGQCATNGNRVRGNSTKYHSGPVVRSRQLDSQDCQTARIRIDLAV